MDESALDTNNSESQSEYRTLASGLIKKLKLLNLHKQLGYKQIAKSH